MESKFKSYDSETNVEEAINLVQEITGKQVSDIDRTNSGEVNVVYFVRTDDEKDYVLRISPNLRGHDNFNVEAWAFKQIIKLGVPVPEVVAVDTTKKTFPEAYMLTQRMPGVSGNLVKLDEDQKRKVIMELGHYYSLIHKVKIKGFGKLVKKGKGFVGHNATLLDAIDDDLKNSWWVKEGLKKGLVDKDEINNLRTYIDTESGIFDINEGTLVHGDLSASFKNLNLEDGKISGIFDMENAKSYDPVFDFAWFDFFSRNEDYLGFLKEGYDDKSIFDEKFETKKNIYELMIAYSLLFYYSKRNNESGLEFVRSKLTVLKNKLGS